MKIKDRKELFQLVKKGIITEEREITHNKRIYSTIIFDKRRDTFYQIFWGYIGKNEELWFQDEAFSVTMNDKGEWMTSSELKEHNQNKFMYSKKESTLNEAILFNVKPFIRSDSHPSKLKTEILIISSYLSRMKKSTIITNSNKKDFYEELTKGISKKIYSSKRNEVSKSFSESENVESRTKRIETIKNIRSCSEFSKLVFENLNNVKFEVFSKDKKKSEKALESLSKYIDTSEEHLEDVVSETIKTISDNLNFLELLDEEKLISDIRHEASKGCKIFLIDSFFYRNNTALDNNNDEILDLHSKLSKLAIELDVKVITVNKL